MESSTLEVPPSPPRWSLIPFDIFEDVQRREKRLRVAAPTSTTSIMELPESILAIIFVCISDTRSRNSISLVCMEWYSLERATRTKLCLRGCVSDLHLIPRSFQAVECLDLYHCSPWGYSLFPSIPERAILVGQVLKQAFPRVKDMTIYVRDGRDIDMVACFWPDLQSLKLVRWHQRPTELEESSGLGMEFRFLMQSCRSLKNLDLSDFYCWTEDIPPALMVEPSVSSNLCSLNLLKVSVEGFKASELETISSACTSLEELQIVLVFDPRFLDFVDDATLLHLGDSCKKLRVLHLIDNAAFDDVRGDPEAAFAEQDAQISRQGLEGVFRALPLLEDLAIVLSQNVRDARPVLEVLAASCKRLTSLCLGHFHGLCTGLQPNGVAMCHGLVNLIIKNCADLDDVAMVAIASGCNGLHKLGLHSCREVSRSGLYYLTRHLSQSLVDVQVICCLQLGAVDTLWALQPIQGTIVNLHLDFLVDPDFVAREIEDAQKKQSFPPPSSCSNLKMTRIESVLMNRTSNSPQLSSSGWDHNSDVLQKSHSIESLDLNVTPTSQESDIGSSSLWHQGSFKDNSADGYGILTHSSSSSGGLASDCMTAELPADQGTRSSTSVCDASVITDGLSSHSSGRLSGLGESSECGTSGFSVAFRGKEWGKLTSLSLWAPIGELFTPLPIIGLQFCPSLQEVHIKVEGDCRACPKPKVRSSGISIFASYGALSKLTLDCSDIVGYALSAPQGHMELSLWERWYLQGIERVKISELDYWPPQDRDANRRGLSLPSAGLISQCPTLRKLILHGTINEHLLRMFLNAPNLRDVQLRLDYYPAPEVELNTETRADACRRFEACLNERGFPD